MPALATLPALRLVPHRGCTALAYGRAAVVIYAVERCIQWAEDHDVRVFLLAFAVVLMLTLVGG
jgi:hypothetical protein